MTPLGDVADLLGSGSVTVLVPSGVDLTTLESPGRVLRRLDAAGAGPDRLHDALVGLGHADALVDLQRRPPISRLPVLLQHVRPGGLLVLALPRRDGRRAEVLGLMDELLRLRAATDFDPPARRSDPRPTTERDRHALAALVTAVSVEGDLLMVTRSEIATWDVVPEQRFDALLACSPGLGRVLVGRAGETWTTTSPFLSSTVSERGLGVVQSPSLSLREHDNVVVLPQAVARVGSLVLPQAFRDTVRRRPRTPALADWSAWSVRVPGEVVGVEPTRLPGTWFHLDNVLRGHFGHAVTEQLSLLWAWPEVLERYPDAGVLVTSARGPLADWEFELLEAGGVARTRIHATAVPVRVDRLVAATPGYVILRHAHPSLRHLYRATGDALEARSDVSTPPRRMFVTRTGTKRRCHQQVEVEALFVRHGFTLIAPEEHSLADQVAMARSAEVVAGWGGSGMFHLMLGGAPRPIIAVSHRDYHLWNEKMIAALWDHPLTVVRGTPDVVTDQFSTAAMHSDYSLDLDPASPTGRLLAEALADL